MCALKAEKVGVPSEAPRLVSHWPTGALSAY